jgi:cardiolipin synthase
MADADAPCTEPLVAATVDGNRLTLLADGPARLGALIGLIEGAKESLRVLYYMFLDDASGARVRDALIAAAERGVKVSMLVDDFGSDAADAVFCDARVRRQGRFLPVQPPLRAALVACATTRNLRLPTGRRVIIGGFNVSDDYFGTHETGAWRDLGLKVEGKASLHWRNISTNSSPGSNNPKGKIRDLRHMLNQHSRDGGKAPLAVRRPDPAPQPMGPIVRRDMKAGEASRPRRRLLRAIPVCFAASPASHAGERRASSPPPSRQHRYHRGGAKHLCLALKRNVEIYEYQPTKLHTKLFVVDDAVHIGSANFDMRSLFLNLEMMLRVEDAGFAAAMRRFVDGEVQDSLPITWEEHRAHRGCLNRIKWAVGLFPGRDRRLRISRMLNFGASGASPSRPRKGWRAGCCATRSPCRSARSAAR